jgi:hypothetical protein
MWHYSENEMDNSCNINSKNINHKFLLEKPEGKMPLGKIKE